MSYVIPRRRHIGEKNWRLFFYIAGLRDLQTYFTPSLGASDS